MVTQLLVSRGMPKATRADARYTQAGGRERCGGCRHFMAPSVCNRILGPVTAVGWCRYFSQQPPRRAANFPGMGPPGKSLDLSFMSPGALPSSVTFTRASTATYFNSAGVMQTAATNAPRWDYNPGTLALSGLLIEEARTNLCLQSANLAVAPWTGFGSGAAAPVPTANSAVAPDGTTTACRIVYPAVPAAATSIWYQPIAGISATPYSFSVWLRGAVGGEQLYLMLSGSSDTSPRLTLTTQWQRFTYVATPSGGNFQIGADLATYVAQSATPAQTIYAWGAQVEQAAFATSYIPTIAATVTRAIDQCSIQPANMGWLVAPGGSWFAEIIVNYNVPGNTMIISAPSGNPAPQYITAFLSQWDGAATVQTANFSAPNVVAKGVTSLGGGTGRCCLNAGVVASGTGLSTGYGALASSGVYFLTPFAAGNTQNMGSGYIRRFSYWPRVLSNAEMQAVTT